MDIKIEQISSLDKIFNGNKYTPVSKYTALGGERFSYQLMIEASVSRPATVTVNSPLAEYIKIYREREVFCDLPSYDRPDSFDEDYLTHAPAMIPDALEELGCGGRVRIGNGACILWVRCDVPSGMKPGSYDISVTVSDDDGNEASAVMTAEILGINLPESDLKYTQWFHTDCISSFYNTEIYSERHWQLIDSFIAEAADCGINMLLTPIHTPPLDTAVGSERPNVQLVKISEKNGKYSFDFSLFERWVGICRSHGIKYFEMPPFFTQWGAKAAPNIYVNGEHKFGWDTDSCSEEYINFLRQYITAVADELKTLGICDNTYFHISDEPDTRSIEIYEMCSDIIKSIDKNLKVIDALSEVDFYQKGLVKIPVPASNAIEPFLKEDIKERWVYYCCGQGCGVSNRFMAMSSYRNRIIGVQLYKFGISGFLHWGYNFYYSQFSEYKVNPYLTTSSDGAFPSGDPFSVYPGENGAIPSVRAFVFYEALQDAALLKLLESKKGREGVVKLIDETAGFDVRFSEYPKDEQYLFKLRERIIDELREG